MVRSEKFVDNNVMKLLMAGLVTFVVVYFFQ